jgi:GNAT superfamily N-acetyltransferase
MNLTFEYLADRLEVVPQVARWWFDEWGYLRPDDSIETLTSRVLGLLNRDKLPIQILASLDKSIVGIASLKRHEIFDLYPDKVFWLGDVYVAPEIRGQGIGSALAAKIVEIAESRGIKSIHLQTQSLNGGLYAKLGWKKIEQFHNKGYDALLMVKQVEVD